MKKTLFASLLLAFTALSANAVVIQLTPDFGPAHTTYSTYYIAKNGTGPGNGNDTASQLYRLNTYFLNNGTVTLADAFKPSNINGGVFTSGLSAYSYAVVHYGNGGFGGDGGSIGAWQLNGADSFSFPSQGISSVDFFGPRPPSTTTGVPDGGSTVALLGLLIAGLAIIRRRSITG